MFKTKKGTITIIVQTVAVKKNSKISKQIQASRHLKNSKKIILEKDPLLNHWLLKQMERAAVLASPANLLFSQLQAQLLMTKNYWWKTQLSGKKILMNLLDLQVALSRKKILTLISSFTLLSKPSIRSLELQDLYLLMHPALAGSLHQINMRLPRNSLISVPNLELIAVLLITTSDTPPTTRAITTMQELFTQVMLIISTDHLILHSNAILN